MTFCRNTDHDVEKLNYIKKKNFKEEKQEEEEEEEGENEG